MKFFDDLRNLDRNDVGAWPRSIKVFFMLLILVLVLVAGWYFKIQNQQEDLRRVEAQETSLKQTFSTKQAKAASLPALERQLAEMREMLKQLLRQLPGKTEMPKLLVDISQIAQAAGLATETFEPGKEVRKEFYAEEPIHIKMSGSYHQFGKFVSDVASLPRVVILTMHDVSLTPSETEPSNDEAELTLQGVVKTYRYLEEVEDKDAKNES